MEKRDLLTGATDGIGLETAKMLVSLPDRRFCQKLFLKKRFNLFEIIELP